jgi:hypothetical protein
MRGWLRETISVVTSRTPPADIRRTLRQEVGFVCPADGCASPYLTWHHFDQPWADGQAHDPDGMIALCLEHHKRADAGAFSRDDLRDMKRRRAARGPTGQFDYRLDQLVLRAGSVVAVQTPVFVQYRRHKVIWLSTGSRGEQMLNLVAWGTSGNLVFKMTDNDWIVADEVEDVECPPSASSLIVRARSEGVRVEIAFHRHPRMALPGGLARLTSDFAGDEVIVCDLLAKLPRPVDVHISETRTLVGPHSLASCVVHRVGAAIAID